MSSPSALMKVNYLVIRYLHFGSVRGDLQERPLLCFPSTKTPFSCQNDQKAHKNADFVLGGPHRTARSGSAGLTEQHGAARRSTEQHGAARRGMEQPPETGQDRLGRSATARSTTKRNRNTTQHTQHNATHATQRNTRNATQAPRNCTMGNNKKGDNLSDCLL